MIDSPARPDNETPAGLEVRSTSYDVAAYATVAAKGYLPPGVNPASTPELAFHINRFPLGDIDCFSVARASYAQSMMPWHSDAWQRFAPWEKAYYGALAEVGIKALGDTISGIDGGYLAPEFWSKQWFGLLRSFSAIDQLPVTRITVPARVAKLPRLTTDLTVSYSGENTAPTATTLGIGQLTYTARKAIAVINVSNELMTDAPETADQVLRQEGARAIALDRDTQALNGQGGPNPDGLLALATAGVISKYYVPASATANIQAGANNATPSFNHLSQLRGKVHQLNNSTLFSSGQAHCNGMVAHSRIEQTVLTLQAGATGWTDAQGRPLWTSDLGTEDGPNSLLGQKWVLTNILTTTSTDGGGTTSSFVIAGDWRMYVLFECPTLGYAATQQGQGFASGQTQVRLLHRYDLGPAHPEAFAVLAGVNA